MYVVAVQMFGVVLNHDYGLFVHPQGSNCPRQGASAGILSSRTLAQLSAFLSSLCTVYSIRDIRATLHHCT
jgi:hypothetical protein